MLRQTITLILAILCILVTRFGFAQPGGERPLYRDPTQPIQRRVEDLLGRMTLAEKIGQMNMPCVYERGLGDSIEAKTAGVREWAEGTLIEGLGPSGGYFTLPNTILHEGTRQQVLFLNELQRIAATTRLGIPLLETEEGTHGLMCSGATIFPEGPALGSTWNLDLISRIYTAVAWEARSIGIHQIFTLVVEPIRDPRLGRNQEAYSEDPFLCSRIAETIVRAAQGDDVSSPDHVVAGLCHYPGQSQPVSGLERGAMEISERILRETFLPSWEAGIKKAGGLGVMATYPAIDGVPTHASEWLLTQILRKELGFRGLVLSEGGGIGTLVYEGLAPNQKIAGQLALRAGVDVGISFESGYMQDLVQSVQEGAVPMQLIDRAVGRILEQKFRLGLFENAQSDLDGAVEVVHSANHQDLALEAAREGVVLLKNRDELLPLSDNIRSLAVIGPNADNERNQLGDYVAHTVPQDVVTVFDGIRQAVSPTTRVTYVKGCDVTTTPSDEIAEAKSAAAEAEVAVVVLGENEWQARDEDGRRVGTDGEGFDSATLELTGRQQELVQAVVETGTPTVVVLINGRPLATRWIDAHVPAVVEAWIPGEKGSQAVAEILFGKINPSGKLSMTVPRHVGQLPVYYNHKKSKRYWIEKGWGVPYVDMEPAPLYPFGHGLSYTTFDYANLRITPGQTGPNGTVTIQMDLRNGGSRFGKEVVQLYIEDLVATVATPVKELRGFEKVGLKPGETRTVTFELTPDLLALYDRHMQRTVEPGRFKVMVGSSSQDIRLTGIFTVRNR